MLSNDDETCSMRYIVGVEVNITYFKSREGGAEASKRNSFIVRLFCR